MSLKDLGIEVLEQSEQVINLGLFAKPANFPSNKAAKWELYHPDIPLDSGKKEQLVGIPVRVPAWEVWIDPKLGEKKATVRVGDNGKKYVLMCRDSKIQNVVTRMYGNVSRKRINMEAQGETVAGNGRQDYGMLTTKDLNAVGQEPSTPEFPENSVELEEDTVVESRNKQTRK